MSVLKISKLEAARRQLETAVRLYFSEGDPVSIHTLTAAAYNVIRDINKKNGGKPMFAKDAFAATDTPEQKKKFLKRINSMENFCKHADNDPDSILNFAPDITDMLIFEACDKYRELTHEVVPLFQVMVNWFLAQHPDLFNLPPETAKDFDERMPMSRGEFFRLYLPAVSQLIGNTTAVNSANSKPFHP